MNNKQLHKDVQSPKSDEIKKVVTLALPEKTLSVLETYDQDLAQAVVKVTDRAIQKPFPKGSWFEIVKVAPHKSVFIVGSDTLLSKIPWIKLVEVAPGRNLITLPAGTPLEALEVAILELIESMPSEESKEKTLLKEFCKYIGRLRRYNKMSVVKILVVDTDE
jgi:hypothetical protein